jgi:hypothetical protein
VQRPSCDFSSTKDDDSRLKPKCKHDAIRDSGATPNVNAIAPAIETGWGFLDARQGTDDPDS